MTQEFELSVTPVGNSQYLIRTERMPLGAPVAQELVTWPVEQWLTEAQQLMGDPLKGLLRGSGSDVGRELSLVELGQKLYASLFRGTVRDSWVIAQGVAQNRRAVLRLRLGLKDTELTRLPWEVMYGTDVPVEQLRQGSITSTPRPMVAGTRIIFSRYQVNSINSVNSFNSRLPEDSLPELLPDQPIRVLMVVSAPTDQEQLKLYREVKHIQQELESGAAPGSTHAPGGSRKPTAAKSAAAKPAEIQLTILNQPGREELARTLERGQFQVLHYSGHSDPGSAGGLLYLVNSQTGLSEILTGDDLAGLLFDTGIRLAVFNSCRGAYVANSELSGNNRNLTEALVSRGIQAVLAMSEQIPDNVALNLTRWFYYNLKQGSPIDLSLNRARQGLIATYGSQQFYWALPVLYLHPQFDGYLSAHHLNQAETAAPYNLLPPNYLSESRLPEPLIEPPVRPPANPALPTIDSREFLAKAALRPDDLSVNPAADLAAPSPAIAKLVEQLSPSVESAGSANRSAQYIAEPAVEPGIEPGIEPVAELNGRNSGEVASPNPTAELQAAENSAPSLFPNRSQSSPTAKQSAQKLARRPISRFWLLPLLGAVAGAATYVGLYGMPVVPDGLPVGQWLSWPGPAQSPESPSPVDPTASIEELRAIATVSLRQGQAAGIEQGIEAIELLLKRNALDQASEALSAAPAEVTEDARLNFLRGRLAWQGMKAADGQHTLEQALSFWESAVQADPDNLAYQQALMFAYYSADDARSLEKALQTWSTANANPAITQAEIIDFKALTALVMQKRADDKSDPKRDNFLLTAVLRYQEVMSRDPQRFTPEALAQNWLWTEEAIKGWQALSQIKVDSSQPLPAATESSEASPATSPATSPSASPSASPSIAPSASPAP